ncbi:MAG: hypothetical protein JST29_10065 [Bacteroidetes bacterium]|nr:hypothetical protein [Bacteroidota bacterium]MBS1590497.1 hypothetical protein [Bacteroidota bacterium]
MITDKKKKNDNSKQLTITKTKQTIINKYFGKAPVFGDGLLYQQKMRSK